MEQDVLELAIDEAGHEQAARLADTILELLQPGTTKVRFDRIAWPIFTKDVSELRIPKLNIRAILVANAVRDLADEVDGRVFQAIDMALDGTSDETRSALVIVLEKRAAERPELAEIAAQAIACVIGQRKLRV